MSSPRYYKYTFVMGFPTLLTSFGFDLINTFIYMYCICKEVDKVTIENVNMIHDIHVYK